MSYTPTEIEFQKVLTRSQKAIEVCPIEIELQRGCRQASKVSVGEVQKSHQERTNNILL